MFKNGFTLSEVLITLGIIGVVAALTIPAIVSVAQINHAYSKTSHLMSPKEYQQPHLLQFLTKACWYSPPNIKLSKFKFNRQKSLPLLIVEIKRHKVNEK